jgi:hypothetical protein
MQTRGVENPQSCFFGKKSYICKKPLWISDNRSINEIIIIMIIWKIQNNFRSRQLSSISHCRRRLYTVTVYLHHIDQRVQHNRCAFWGDIQHIQWDTWVNHYHCCRWQHHLPLSLTYTRSLIVALRVLWIMSGIIDLF